MPGPNLRFAVVDTPTQELAIVTRGDVTLRETDERDAAAPAAGGDDPSAEPIPDPVALFVTAARLHMFPAPSVDPWDSDAELVARRADPALVEVTQRVRLRNVHRGALRVLANLLIARLPEMVRIETATAPPGHDTSLLDLTKLDYPAAPGQLPFRIDRQELLRSSRDRLVQIVFERPPEDEALGAVYAGLDAWSQLPLFGGYPDEGTDPWQSSAGPSPAFLLDPYTVEQAFPDLFLCDDDCFACVVNWAICVHRSVCPVASIVLR